MSLAAPLAAMGQAGPPSLSALDNVAGCVVEAGEVFVITGQGTDRRRYKYAWDAAIDAFCNARGFAIATPDRAAVTPRVAPPASAPPSMAATRSASAPVLPLAAPTPGAQTAARGGPDFPDGARELTADELLARLEGKVFTVRTATGASAGRLQYNRGGVVYLNSGAGFNTSGQWRVENSTICYRWNGASPPSGCYDARVIGTQLHVRSSAGPIIRLDE